MVNKENKEKQNGGEKKETGFPAGSNPARLSGTKKMNCLLVQQPDLFFLKCSSQFLNAFSPPRKLIDLLFVSLALLNISPPCIYICSPDVGFGPVSKLSVVFFRSLKPCVPSIDFSRNAASPHVPAGAEVA